VTVSVLVILSLMLSGSPLLEFVPPVSAASPPAPFSVPPGIAHYVPITISNSQSSRTPAPFQQMVYVDTRNYTPYESSDLGNLEFFDAGGRVIPSWLESDATTGALFWVKILDGIPANSNMTIYLGFGPTATSFLNGLTTGEAPELSGTYAQFDTGAVVFPVLYQNFAGTSVPSGWNESGGVTVSNELQVPGGNAQIQTTSNYGLNKSQILDFYGSASTAGFKDPGDEAGGYSVNPPSGNGYVGWVFNGPLGRAGTGDMATGHGGSIAFTTNGTNNILSTYAGSSSSSSFDENYGPFDSIGAGLNAQNPVMFLSFFTGVKCCNSGTITVQWVRIRAYPPNGVMPTTSFGGLTVAVSAAVSLSPSSGVVGTLVTISGVALLTSQDLTVTLAGSDSGMPTTCSTSASGNINSGCSFVVPPSVSGPYTVSVSDGSHSPTATFTVIASISLSPSSGGVGTNVTITGAAFRARSILAVNYRGSSTPLPTACSTDSSGGIIVASASLGGRVEKPGCTFIVPSASTSGPHAVTVTDDTNSATATFTVSSVTVSCKSCRHASQVVGQAAVFNATVLGSLSAPTGNIVWSNSSAGSFSPGTCRLLPDGKGLSSSCLVKFTPTSAMLSVTLTANYGGDQPSGKDPPANGTYGLTVTMKPTRTTVSCQPIPATAGSSNIITCTANEIGYKPTGDVTWSQTGKGSVSFGSTICTLVGKITKQKHLLYACSVNMTGVTAGTVTLGVAYDGDSNNQGSTRPAKYSYSIRRATSVVTLSCAPAPVPVGDSSTCTATVSGGYPSHTRTVTFTWSQVSGLGGVKFSSTTCALSSGSCSVTVTATAAGSVEIKAAYGGDSNNFKSSGALILTIT